MNFRYKDNDGYFGPIIKPADYSYEMMGLALDNSINFIRNHFIFGFNVKLGWMAEEHENSHYFMQFGMRFGGIL